MFVRRSVRGEARFRYAIHQVVNSALSLRSLAVESLIGHTLSALTLDPQREFRCRWSSKVPRISALITYGV